MQENNSSRSKTILIIIGIVIALLCFCLVLSAVAGYWIYKNANDLIGSNGDVSFGDTSTPTPSAPIVVERPPVDEIPLDTLATLEETIVPPNDLIEIACRLKGICDIPKTMDAPTAPRQVGDTDTFWATDIGTNESFEVNATLRYVTDHSYFWVQDGVSYDENDMKKLMDTFENEIYPTNRAFFGSEWSPGIDGDEHIYILYARGIGYSIAGYYSSADEYHPLAHEYSNAHEMFLFNADNTYLHEDFTYGVLAHEFQHMIHWYQDSNESSWLNEGFSELATFLNDLDPGGFDWVYTSNPDLQLNDWPNDQNATTPHYGAAFMFTTYFLDRFGEEATQALAADDQNGMDSVDNTLRSINATDPVSGKLIGADDVVIDWLVANFLKDGNVGDGRYTYHNYPDSPQPSATELIIDCPYSTNYNVHQYGGDYIQIECAGDYTLHFEGATQTGLLPADPYSGDYAFWSNKGDESDMTLTRSFDFSNISGPITFSFQTWYDIETDYDYVYFEVSEDGEHWEIITTPSGTDEDPSGNSYGWAYNDVTNGWMQEDIDLSAYAGKRIQVRFEYVTDAAVNGEGMLIDDVRIDAIDYFTDFESDNGGWEAAGFVRVQNILPQTFRLALITKSGRDTSVQMIELSDAQTADIPFSLNSGDEAILVVTGTTRFTRELANYSIEITYPTVEVPETETEPEVTLPPLPESSQTLRHDEESGLLVDEAGMPVYSLNEAGTAWEPIISDNLQKTFSESGYTWALLDENGMPVLYWDPETHTWIEIPQEEMESQPVQENPENVVEHSIVECSLAAPSQLISATEVEIISPLNFRTSPAIQGNNWITTLQPGTQLVILGDTFCTEYDYGAYLWWHLETEDGLRGWAVEAAASQAKYFLRPIP